MSPAAPRARVAAAICYRLRRGRVQFLLVRTSSGSRWTLPKGHVNRSESRWQAAAREAREEAGVTGIVDRRALIHYIYPTRTSHPGEFTDAVIAAFLMAVTGDGLPFEPGRSPTWYSAAAAGRQLVQGWEPRHGREHARVLKAAVAAIESRAR